MYAETSICAVQVFLYFLIGEQPACISTPQKGKDPTGLPLQRVTLQ